MRSIAANAMQWETIFPQVMTKPKVALGINFVHFKERLTEDFYHRFVLDPPRLDIATKMPKLSADGKLTKLNQFFDGDANQQFHAVRQFIQSLNDQPL